MAFIKRPDPWVNGNDVVPNDLQRYEDALDDHETNKANSTDLALKLNKSDVVSNLTTTDAEKALAAPQGKALAEQITYLSDTVVWKDNNWKTESAKPSDYPAKQTTTFYAAGFNGNINNIVETKSYNKDLIIQFLYPYSADTKKTIQYRYGITTTDTWEVWKELPTTDKIDISFPFDSGYTFAFGGLYANKIVKNNFKQGFIYGCVKKVDETNFSANVAVKIGTLATGTLPTAFFANGSGALYNNGGTSIAGNAAIGINVGINGIYVTPSAACYAITFTLPYELA